MVADWSNPCAWDGGKRLDFGHVGGTATTGDPDSWYPELWTWLMRRFLPATFLDVGCGVGFAQRFFRDHQLATMGLDCPEMAHHHLLNNLSTFIPHDLTIGPWRGVAPYGLVWCCEVAEHLEEQYVDNLIETLVGNCHCLLAFSAAGPGSGGYHHVNCQPPEYWRDKLTKAGLVFLPWHTSHARSLCPEAYGRSPENYFGRTGMIFAKGYIDDKPVV